MGTRARLYGWSKVCVAQGGHSSLHHKLPSAIMSSSQSTRGVKRTRVIREEAASSSSGEELKRAVRKYRVSTPSEDVDEKSLALLLLSVREDSSSGVGSNSEAEDSISDDTQEEEQKQQTRGSLGSAPTSSARSNGDTNEKSLGAKLKSVEAIIRQAYAKVAQKEREAPVVPSVPSPVSSTLDTDTKVSLVSKPVKIQLGRFDQYTPRTVQETLKAHVAAAAATARRAHSFRTAPQPMNFSPMSSPSVMTPQQMQLLAMVQQGWYHPLMSMAFSLPPQ